MDDGTRETVGIPSFIYIYSINSSVARHRLFTALSSDVLSVRRERVAVVTVVFAENDDGFVFIWAY